MLAVDPRIRPWYLTAVSGPKDVVIVIDMSFSMSQEKYMSRMRTYAKKILDTLNTHDYVSLVVARENYYDYYDNFRWAHSKQIGCHPGELSPATTSVKASLKNAVDDLKAEGGTNMYEGLALAYELLDTSPRTSTCEQYVIVIGDGQKLDCNGDCSEGKKAYKDRAGNAYTRTARHGNGYWTCCGGEHCSPCWIPGKIKNYKDQWNEARDLAQSRSERM